MRALFPGMDPWLEDPALWPDVHNRLVNAIADSMAPQVAPKYYIGLPSRTYLVGPEDLSFIGVPDLAFVKQGPTRRAGPHRPGLAAGAVEVLIRMAAEMHETYLEVRDTERGKLVTLIELLSPANKVLGKGRRKYMKKRERVLESRTNLVEVDMIRDGEPMPHDGRRVASDYRILVSARRSRPRALLFPFNVRDPIPTVSLPLLPVDAEPEMDLGTILHAMVERARFDLRLHYDQPPTPPLRDEDAAWARAITG